MKGSRRVWRLFWVVPILGAAVAAGWFASQWQSEKRSLMEGPATAPARLEKGDGVKSAPTIESETAVNSVQSALDETQTIRTDGPASAAVGGAADGHPDELLDLVTSESRLVTVQLAKELDGLQRDLADRNQRIRKLSEALAEAQATLDIDEARRAQEAGSEATLPADAPIEARIVDANTELGLVILDQGARQGVRYGLPLTVMRGRRRVARIRVVDVRERIAGAVVEETARGDTPQTGDRAALIRPERP
jgi:paraquat-inducible protein B